MLGIEVAHGGNLARVPRVGNGESDEFREICWPSLPPGATLSAMNATRREGNSLGHAARILLSVLGVLLAGCQRPAEKAAAPVPKAPPPSSGEVAATPPPVPEQQPPSSGAVVETPPPVPKSIPMPEPTGPWQGFGEPGPGRISVTVLGNIKHQGQYFLAEGANLETVYQSCGGSGGQGDFGGSPPPSVDVNRNGKVTTYRITRMTTEAREAVKLEEGDVWIYSERIF
jgi:hypothetical protein